MKSLADNIDAKLHNEILLSLKYLEGDVSIEDSRWDFIFDFYSKSREFYFLGRRLQ